MRTLVVIAVAVTLAACKPSKRSDLPLPPIDPTRISHDRHAALKLPCDKCHQGGRRPGVDNHAPCDDAGCHPKEFLGVPGLFCQVCHESVTTQPLRAPLKPYPLASEAGWQSLPPMFSHRKHLDSARMEARVGFHIACADCHTRDDARVRPDHATCARCHASEVALPGAPRMEQCNNCHQGAPRVRTRKRLIRGDLKSFDHDRHRADRKNNAIRCEQCHAESAQSASYGDHAPPRVEACVGCHDDTDRTPYERRMRICEGCHATRSSTLTTIAPRSHLPATERPLDHTIAFRRDHAEAAGRDAARCATCHTQMSGNRRQACDECHQTMSPSDHRITWRELDHGPEVAADRERCATCHVVEFCTACHAQRPRSHGLVGTFLSEHGRLARINVRPCLTCHVTSFGDGNQAEIIDCADCHATPALRGIR